MGRRVRKIFSVMGEIFKLNPDGTGFTNFYSFSTPQGDTNSDGFGPLSGLALEGDTLYGAALSGGLGGKGTLFKINTNGSGFTAFLHVQPADRWDERPRWGQSRWSDYLE